MTFARSWIRHAAIPLTVVLALLGASCGDDGAPASAAGSANADEATAPVTVRLGYFPNVTHASAIVGVERGIFVESLGTDILTTQTFNAGPAAVEALLAGAIDATYIGPNPAINAWSRSKAIRVISGATSGGAALVVKPSITSIDQLKGKRIASPQLGNTQDVALRHHLKKQGLKTNTSGGGDVAVVPQENAQTLETFKAGTIDGAWVPEPWVSRLVLEGGGKVLVDEAELWDDGDFVTTHLIVRADFLREHPATVKRLLRGQVEANEFLETKRDDARTIVNKGIEKLTGKGLAEATITAAFEKLRFTNDPVSSSLKASAAHAADVGVLAAKVDLDGIYALDLLNDVLREAGSEEVSGS